MVAETRDNVTNVFDNMTETFRTMMDAGRRTQETFFKTMGEAWKTPMGFDAFVNRGEKLAKEFMPFFGRNLETMAETFDVGFRAGMDVIKTAADVTMKNDETDVYRRSKQVWDSAFGAVRTNFEAMGKAGGRTMDNWTSFCKTTCGEDTVCRPATKPTKP